jgi:hypothetical protein
VELFVDDAVMRYNYCGGYSHCIDIVLKDFAYQLNEVSEALRPCITGMLEKETEDEEKPRVEQENAAKTIKKVMELFDEIQINATEPLKGRLINELLATEVKILNEVVDIEKFSLVREIQSRVNLKCNFYFYNSQIQNCFSNLNETVQTHAGDAEKKYCKGVCIDTVTNDFKREMAEYANGLGSCFQKELN